RYQSARALASDLEHWLADEPVGASPDSIVDRLSGVARRHRSYVRAGALAVTLIAVVSVLAALLINNSRKEAIRSRNDAVKSERRERDAKSQAQDLATRNAELAITQTK